MRFWESRRRVRPIECGPQGEPNMANGGAGKVRGGPLNGSGPSGSAKALGAALVLVLAGSVALVLWKPSARDTGSSEVPASGGVESVALAQPPQLGGGDAPVLIRLMVRNDFPQADRDILNAVLDILPTRALTLDAPADIGAVIRQQYRVTPQNNQGLYALLDQRVRSRSEIVNGQLAPGVARIPQLAPLFAGPAFGTLDASIKLRAGRDRSSTEVPTFPDGRTVLDPGAQAATTSYLLQTTIAELESPAWQLLLTDAADRADVELIGLPFDIDLAIRQPGVPTPAYEAPVDPLWRAAIKNASRDVTLFVLDSGWPDEASWRSSLTELDALVSEARTAHKFGNGPSLKAAGGFIGPDAKSHCLDVQESLAPFTGLSPRVRIVYVPLIRAQGAERLLRELIVVGLAIDLLGSNTAESQAVKALKEAEAQADQHLNTISTGVTNTRLTANVALLRGLFLVAERRATRTNGRYFVNASWTTKEKRFLGHPVWPSAGFVVAAAGNEDAPNIFKAGVSFAGLTHNTRTGVAVLNLDDGGAALCHSSLVPPVPGDLGAVGYDGRITNDCGTSFAAPRVSWILAAWDSLRSPADTEDYVDWIDRLRRRLEPQGPGNTLKHLLFDPARFFSQ